MTKTVFFYKVGKGNNENYMGTLVPYKVSNQELFFGPCKKALRKIIKEDYLEEKDFIDLESNEEYKGNEIFVVGIGNFPKINPAPSNFIFTGKIKKIFTFQKAWHYYNSRKDTEPCVKKMINGHGNPKKSPLHLKPIPIQVGAELKGYEHYSHEHDGNWVYDIISGNKRGGEVKSLLKKLNLFERYDRKKNDLLMKCIKEHGDIINKDEKNGITFKLDCCFSMENIFISQKNNESPIPIDNFFLKRMQSAYKNIKNLDVHAPMGYCKDGVKPYTAQGQIYRIEGNKAKEFIEHLNEKLNNKKRGEIKNENNT